MNAYVTGVGVLSSIGMNVDENLRSLRSGESGIKRDAGSGLLVGRVELSNAELLSRLKLPDGDYSRTSLLGLVAAKEAWGHQEVRADIRTGFIGATSVGGLDKIEQYYSASQKDPSKDLFHLMTHENGRTTEVIAEALQLSGYIDTISTACSSGANAIAQGVRLIEAGILNRAVVGASDPIVEFNLKGFSALNIYDNEPCRPFDQTRKGLNIGEGAAFLVLESQISLFKTGNSPICKVSGWKNSTDAYHQTASSADGTGSTLAMMGAIEKAGLETREIDYVNAHGTGTANNDLSESIAIKNVFGDYIPPFSSTKGFTGHTLGAAGAIEAVYCILAITNKLILPNINFTTPMEETMLVPQKTLMEKVKIRHALSSSFGFGGNCTSLIFSNVN